MSTQIRDNGKIKIGGGAVNCIKPSVKDTGKIKTGTFDLSPTILQAVVDGRMEWGIDAQQYLMGYIPVVAFDLMKRYKLAPIADYPTGPGFVGKAEAASVIELAKQGVR